MNAQGGVHATRNHNNVTGVLGTLCSSLTMYVSMQLPGMEHFNWELFDRPLNSLDLSASNYLSEEPVAIKTLQQY
jgi:hypothetical protein